MTVGFYSSNFFNDFNSIFGKPRNFYFNCKTKDQMPSFWEKTEEGFKATCRTVGISENDVKVSVENDCIKVTGETIVDDFAYNCNIELPVIQEVLNSVKNIKFKTANGLTFIYIEVDTPKKKEIKIEKL